MNYHNITVDDMLNGDGLRAVLWVSGCDHHCPGCQNRQTWDACSGIPFDQAAKDELFSALARDYISGVTFSGGDPLFPGNRETVGALIRRIRQTMPDKTIWLYTGYDWEKVCHMEIVRYLDGLVDGEFVAAKKDPLLCWKGSSNQRVIDVQETLKAGKDALPVLHCADYDEN